MGIQFHIIPTDDEYAIGLAESNPTVAKGLAAIPKAEPARSRTVTFADFKKATPAVAARIPKLTLSSSAKHKQFNFERAVGKRAPTTADGLLINVIDSGHWIQGDAEDILIALGEELAVHAGPQLVINDSDDPDLVWLCRAPAAPKPTKVKSTSVKPPKLTSTSVKPPKRAANRARSRRS
ncbi:MAG: hypothetical protein ABI467_30275 [Kofleriaceae bacterium]